MSGNNKRRKNTDQLVSENLQSSASIDPLAWLRGELGAVDDIPELAPERVSELEELATWLKKSSQPPLPPLPSPALEAFLALCPSQSLTASLIERVEARRKAALDARRVSQSASSALGRRVREAAERETLRPTEKVRGGSFAAPPGAVFSALRAWTQTPLEPAASALGVAPSILEQVESGAPVWEYIQPARLPYFAALVQRSCDHVVIMLKVVTRAHLVWQVERRLGVTLARADTLQTVGRAKKAKLKAALTVLRQENQGAQRFFVQAAKVANASRAAPDQRVKCGEA